MRFCDCTNTILNTGTLACDKLGGYARGLILVRMFAEDGTANKIDSSDTLNAAFWTALLNNADTTKRWYPVQKIEFVTDERAETKYETPPSGYKYFAEEGVRSFSGMVMNASYQYLKKLESLSCAGLIGYYEIDSFDNLIGSYNETDGALYPVKIADNSFSARLVKQIPGETQKINIMFDVDQTENDSDLKILSESEAGVKFTNLSGLLDVNIATSAISVTAVTMTLTADYGTFKTPIPIGNWELADFVFYNVTDAASITATSVTETSSGSGVYDVVLPSQTVSDVIRITKASGKTGFDFPSTTYVVV